MSPRTSCYSSAKTGGNVAGSGRRAMLPCLAEAADGKHHNKNNLSDSIGSSHEEEEEDGRSGGSSCDDSNSKLIRKYKVNVCPKSPMSTYLVRAMSVDRAYSRFDELQKRNFLIYYQLPSDDEFASNVNNIPLELPLTIAYKAGNGHVQQSLIKRFSCKENVGNGELWCAIAFDELGRTVPEPYRLGFASVRALIHHYCCMNAHCDVNK